MKIAIAEDDGTLIQEFSVDVFCLVAQSRNGLHYMLKGDVQFLCYVNARIAHETSEHLKKQLDKTRDPDRSWSSWRGF